MPPPPGAVAVSVGGSGGDGDKEDDRCHELGTAELLPVRGKLGARVGVGNSDMCLRETHEQQHERDTEEGKERKKKKEEGFVEVNRCE